MTHPTEAWKKLIDGSLTPRDETCSSVLLLSITNWFALNEHSVLFHLKANEQAIAVLNSTIKRMNAAYKTTLENKEKEEKEKIIQRMLQESFDQIKQLQSMSSTIPVNLDRSAKDEVDTLLTYIPKKPSPIQTDTGRKTSAALQIADAAQTAASAAGGLMGASIQEAADFSARTSHASDQTLVALRNPLPPSIASGTHIASVIASGLNLIAFPIILLVAYLRGKEIKLSKEDVGRLGKSAVTLGLGIAGLIVAPAIVIPLMIASAAFTAGTTLIGLGNFLFERHKQNKMIKEKHNELTNLTKEIKALQSKAFNNFKEGVLTPNELYASYAEKTAQQTKLVHELKTLIKTRDQTGTLRQVVPRSLGFVIGAAVLVGAILLIVPPLAPIGIGIIIGGAAAGIALMSGVFTSNFILSRKAKEKAAEKNAAQLEKQHTELKTHETTATLAKQLGIANSELSHQGRVNEIAERLKKIKAEIKNTDTNKVGEQALIKFFVAYCKVHQNDSQSKLKEQPVFNDIPDKALVDYIFGALRHIVNANKGKIITPEDLSGLQAFDKEHQFFVDHGIGVEFVSKTESEKPQPNAGASHELNKRSPRTP